MEEKKAIWVFGAFAFCGFILMITEICEALNLASIITFTILMIIISPLLILGSMAIAGEILEVISMVIDKENSKFEEMSARERLRRSRTARFLILRLCAKTFKMKVAE